MRVFLFGFVADSSTLLLQSGNVLHLLATLATSQMQPQENEGGLVWMLLPIGTWLLLSGS